MKIIISPAKKMEEERKIPTNRGTQPRFLDDAIQLNRKLARMSKKEISELMHISDRLVDLNYHRYQEFDESNKTSRARPAVYLYDGDTYSGLDAYSLPGDKLDDLQNTLRIITGMYGILRPLDRIQPYRLEMKIKLQIRGNEDLYAFWSQKITDSLNTELKTEELFLNLASKEYSKAIHQEELKGKVISPVFKDFKNGKLKIISFYAKKARGAMTRYLIDHNIDDRDGILGFDYLDYRYSEKYSEKENEPVFVR